jgi:siroheme synthase (precorrin-2 oxidase/ferrochelatase)
MLVYSFRYQILYFLSCANQLNKYPSPCSILAPRGVSRNKVQVVISTEGNIMKKKKKKKKKEDHKIPQQILNTDQVLISAARKIMKKKKKKEAGKIPATIAMKLVQILISSEAKIVKKKREEVSWDSIKTHA